MFCGYPFIGNLLNLLVIYYYIIIIIIFIMIWSSCCWYCSVLKLCPTLCDALSYSRPCSVFFHCVCSNSCPSSQWCYLITSSSAAHFSFCFQFFLPSGSFPVTQIFASGGQSIEASALASVPPMNIRGWFPLGLTGLTGLHIMNLKGMELCCSIRCSWKL